MIDSRQCRDHQARSRPARALAPVGRFALATLGLWLASCDRAPAGPATAGVAGAPAASRLPAPVVAAVPAPVDAPPAVPAPLGGVAGPATASDPIGCRVISCTGPAQRDSGAAVRAGDRFVGSDWLELAQGTSLHLKHGQSGREWTLRGPARILPCVDGLEELIVAQGKLRAEAGAGVRPGAQVLIGTPFGSLRYADASADLDVTRDALRLAVSSGDTWLSSTSAQPGTETHTAGAQALRRGPRQRLAAATAVLECGRAAQQSDSLAQSLLAPAPSALGQLAAEHVRARELARARCASATAAVLQQDQGAERSARLSELAGYRELWRRVPAAGG